LASSAQALSSAFWLARQPYGHQPIASDNFQSDTAGTTINGDGGGSGWTNTWFSDNPSTVNVAAQSLSYSGGSVSATGGNNAVQFAYNSSASGSSGVDTTALARSFNAPTTLTPVYFSFLLNANNTANNEFAQLGLFNSSASGSVPAAAVGVAQVNAGSLDFFIRMPSSGNSQFTSTVFNPNQTYLVVGELSNNTGDAGPTDYNVLSLYVDPTTATQPGTATLSFAADSGLNSVSSFDVRLARFVSGDIYSLGDIQTGTTWADVVPTPEPASIGLLGVGCLGLLARRRRIG
jgi:hypothetical protein